MLKVTSFLDLNARLKAYRKEYRGALTNCYLFGNKLKELIDGGRLSVQDNGNSILLFEDLSTHYHLYYFFPKGECFPAVVADKPVMIRLLFQSAAENHPEIQLQRDKILAAGFRFEVRSRQIRCKPQTEKETILALYNSSDARVDHERFVVTFATNRDEMEAVIGFWKQFFPYYRVPVYSSSKIDDILDKRSQYLVKERSSGIIAAGTLAEQNGNVWEENRLFANPQFRRQGLGAYVFLTLLKDAMEKGCESFMAWIDEGNTYSWKLHEKVCAQTGLVSDQYMMQ